MNILHIQEKINYLFGRDSLISEKVGPALGLRVYLQLSSEMLREIWYISGRISIPDGRDKLSTLDISYNNYF